MPISPIHSVRAVLYNQNLSNASTFFNKIAIKKRETKLSFLCIPDRHGERGTTLAESELLLPMLATMAKRKTPVLLDILLLA